MKVNSYISALSYSINKLLVPLKRKRDGTWNLKLSFKEGRYEYKFVVDDEWKLDPNNNNTVDSGYGTTNSLLVLN